MRRSLVIGKFWPPHVGHVALIEGASSVADCTYVIVCATPTSLPEGRQRALWLQELFPRAEVILTDDFCDWHWPGPCPGECTPRWAKRTAELIPDQIDYFVASEPYGEAFAREIGAKYLEFDAERTRFPVSGSAVRADLVHNWNALPLEVRTGLVRRIAVIGAESTGTTTLANMIASALDTTCCPEVGRTVSWELLARHGSMDAITWTPKVFWEILGAHSSVEERARRTKAERPLTQGTPWIVSDTDALATVTWWKRYVGRPTEDLSLFAAGRLADLYVVTSPDDVPFIQDGVRDGEDVRLGMHEEFLQSVESCGRPYLVARGTPEERLSLVLSLVDSCDSTLPLFRR